MKKRRKEGEDHIHLADLPKQIFPRTGNSKKYAEDLVGLLRSIRYTNEKVQYSAQICSFNIKSISSNASFNPRPPEVFRQIEQFGYHYENYCFRVYVYREKIAQFINQILEIGLSEKRTNIATLLLQDRVKDAGLMEPLERFEKNRTLKSFIEDRNSLTHRIYYGEDFDRYFRPKGTDDKKESDPEDFKRWTKSWRREVMERSRKCDEVLPILVTLEGDICGSIASYKKKRKKIDKILSGK